MKINITTIFGFKLQLTVFYKDTVNRESTLIGLALIKQGEN